MKNLLSKIFPKWTQPKDEEPVFEWTKRPVSVMVVKAEISILYNQDTEEHDYILKWWNNTYEEPYIFTTNIPSMMMNEDLLKEIVKSYEQ